MSIIRDAFYHVFLSFRGETRDKFTCFLHEALKAQGYVAFMDKSNIHVGDEVDSTIKEGIRYSFSAIIIFSPNYAYSAWCLDELVLILREKKKSSTYFIIPIFYDVKIQDIKHQLGNYGSALEKHRERHGDKVEEWKQALVEVGNILGVHVEGQHDEFIRRVVKLYRETVDAKFPKLQVPLKSPTRETVDAKFPKLQVPLKSPTRETVDAKFRKLQVPLKSPIQEPSKDKVILYKTDASNGLRRTKWVKKLKSVSQFVGECFEETDQLLDTSVDKVFDFFSS